MTKLEFEEVLKATDIYNPVEATEEQHGSAEDIHWWNNMAIFFSHSDYTIVKGKIPLEVANTIYEKYPDNQFGITTDGGNIDWDPADFATDDKLEKELLDYEEQCFDYHIISDQEYEEKCQKAEKDFANRKGVDGKYLKSYQIDTKEGLLIFITEMKDYLLRKNGLPETEVEQFDDLIAKVNIRLLRKINPTISAYDWMQGADRNKDRYNESLERNGKTEIGRLLRKVVSNFDKAVNPFIDNTLEFDDINNYSKRVRLYGDSYTYDSDDGYRKDCGFLKIENPENLDYTLYRRDLDSFEFEVSYTIGNYEWKCYSLSHYYNSSSENELDNGEIIAIHNELEDKEIYYNLSNGTIRYSYNDSTPATLEEQIFIYEEILKATRYAEEIAKERMKKRATTKVKNDQ